MQIKFHKYQGTGNDFILIDNRQNNIELNTQQIAQLCDRRFGIGADGLILLELEPGFDFRMVYFNADGNQSSMCGNGGRCITAYAQHLGMIQNSARFLAIDGAHEALIAADGMVSLKMQEVKQIEAGDDFFYLNTGSPHYVKAVENLKNYNVFETIVK